jgi:hypothetical protein
MITTKNTPISARQRTQRASAAAHAALVAVKRCRSSRWEVRRARIDALIAALEAMTAAAVAEYRQGLRRQGPRRQGLRRG